MANPPLPPADITRMLQEWQNGSTLNRLIPIVYNELRHLASDGVA